jgi:hypothetical protein
MSDDAITPPTPPKRRRRRGAQPGNRNAIKHGFYAVKFKTVEISDLETAAQVGLEDEIGLLRVVIRRTLEMAGDVEELDEMIDVLGALGVAATRLAGLLRTQHLISGTKDSGLSATISQALADVVKELRL